eukprot:7087293-Ditylum_brightwellii.AAC.1
MMAKKSNMHAGWADSTAESSPPKNIKCKSHQPSAMSPKLQTPAARFGATHKYCHHWSKIYWEQIKNGKK